jgi:hypothetical protein
MANLTTAPPSLRSAFNLRVVCTACGRQVAGASVGPDPEAIDWRLWPFEGEAQVSVFRCRQPTCKWPGAHLGFLDTISAIVAVGRDVTSAARGSRLGTVSVKADALVAAVQRGDDRRWPPGARPPIAIGAPTSPVV